MLALLPINCAIAGVGIAAVAIAAARGSSLASDGDECAAALGRTSEMAGLTPLPEQLETIERLLERAKVEQDWPTIAPRPGASPIAGLQLRVHEGRWTGGF